MQVESMLRRRLASSMLTSAAMPVMCLSHGLPLVSVSGDVPWVQLILTLLAKDTAMTGTSKHGGKISTVHRSPRAGHSSNDAARDSTGTVVPAKFRGTVADQQDMVILGRKQVLRRNFRFTTILGFASTGQYASMIRI